MALIPILSGLLGVLAGAAITGYFQYRASLVATTADLVNLAGSAGSPDYARVLALSALLKRNLLEPDLVFEAAYRMEDELNSRVITQLFYLAGKEKISFDSPLGHADFEDFAVVSDSGRFLIRGWAIGRRQINEVQVFIDGRLVSTAEVETGLPRPDVAEVFPGLGSRDDRMNSGFSIQIPVTEVSEGHHHLTVRVRDDRFRFRNIFSREVHFAFPEE